MTEIAFHFNVPDKLAYSCRLLRKAYAGGNQVVVTAEASVLDQLDQLLWRFSAIDFVPHCRDTGMALTQAASPVLLAESLKGGKQQGVLINLGQEIPVEFERFERLVEVVASVEGDRLAGRSRWKHYTDRGYSMQRHDLSAAGESA